MLALVLAGALSAQAAGLGRLSVYSGIGQQLNAEIAVIATPGELVSMTAKLASHEAFREAGIEYMPLLSDVRIHLDKNAAGQPVLRLTSKRPISEPFLHFLVELNWTSGRMVREYTFLLDPPELLQAARPASVVAPVTPIGKALPPAPAQPKPAANATGKVQPAATEYRVKPGDTLSKIARETRTETVTLDQMLVALFNVNQDAFVGNNMNRLHAGKILRVPVPEEAAGVDPAEARRLVIAHVEEFSAYRSRLARAAAEMPAAETAPRQQAAGVIAPRVIDKAPAPAVTDKLEVSRTEPVKAAPGTGLEEDLIARDKALREASERIAQLEKNIENLKQLVEIKSQTGIQLQQEVPAAPPKPSAEKPAEPAPAPPPVAKAPVFAPPPPEPGFIEENPALVYGGGGLIALLLGYLGYSSWRRRKSAEQAKAGLAAAPAASAGAQEVRTAPASAAPATAADAGEISIQGEFSDGGLLTDEEIVDPVAEAEVLMAYGRDRQAEEVLLAGLEKDPSRSAIHMKLLELYAKQENVARFEAIAGKLHGLTNGRGADWDKTLAVGRTLGLAGGIFAAAAVVASVIPPEPDGIEPSPPADSQAPVAEPVAPAPPAAGEIDQIHQILVVEEARAIEFGLDFSEPAGAEPVAAAVAEPVAAAGAAPAAREETGLDFDFDFDLGTPEVRERVEAAVDKAIAPADMKLSDLDFDLDLGSPVEAEATTTVVESPGRAPQTPGAAASAGDVDDLKFNLDLDLDLDQEPAGPDLAGLGAPPAPETGIERVAETPEFPVESARPDNSEAATKLELAQAYEEMGDLDGARELLNEVLSEGNSTQQELARTKLLQLNG
ncbi:MAG: LysM peptidoglycan-binding domain-containing protein [Sulfuritalea sp.]|nr:LysM peptidoglycan-binding domain-containing protein [Sulfuritalea sp.]